MPLLEVEDLTVDYALEGGHVQAVSKVSFAIDRGETLGLVGESGCGKSSIGFALMRVLPPGAAIGGRAIFAGEDLFLLDDRSMRRHRWRNIAMVFQAAMNAFNPVLRVSDQVAEPLIKHESLTVHDARKRVAEMFDLVGLSRSRLNAYPHELSGGMKQRAIIAMSLICHPQLLIADEPTTALDVVMQDQILGTIKDLQQEFGFALLIISHDISMIAQTCDRVAVMYGGKIMELADTSRLFAESQHPYTHALFGAYPTLDGPRRTLRSLPGRPPDLSAPPVACRFAPRCVLRKAICDEVAPELREMTPKHAARCHFAGQINAELISVRTEQRYGR